MVSTALARASTLSAPSGFDSSGLTPNASASLANWASRAATFWSDFLRASRSAASAFSPFGPSGLSPSSFPPSSSGFVPSG